MLNSLGSAAFTLLRLRPVRRARTRWRFHQDVPRPARLGRKGRLFPDLELAGGPNAQVSTMGASYRSLMARADKRIGIDGHPADQCLVIADILHHGRSGKMTGP